MQQSFKIVIHISSRTAIYIFHSMRDDNMTIANDICSLWLWQQNTLSHFHFDDWTVAKKKILWTNERMRQATITITTMNIAATALSVAIMCLVSMRNDFLMDTLTQIYKCKIFTQYSWMTVCVCLYRITFPYGIPLPIQMQYHYYFTLHSRFALLLLLFSL